LKRREIFRNQSQANELLASSLDGLQNSTSSALTGLINGTQSLQESFANIGSTIPQQRCKRHCGYGVQYVKSLIVGKAMSFAATAAQIAEAGSLQQHGLLQLWRHLLRPRVKHSLSVFGCL
jgi:hypothetical protein